MLMREVCSRIRALSRTHSSTTLYHASRLNHSGISSTEGGSSSSTSSSPEPESGIIAGSSSDSSSASDAPSTSSAAPGSWVGSHSVTATSRPFSGCGGRALFPNIDLNTLYWLLEIEIEFLSNTQLTPSEHGGVVSEPR